MNKTLVFSLLFIGVIAGVWVAKTRTPPALTSTVTIDSETVQENSAAVTDKQIDAATKAAEAPAAPVELTALQKITAKMKAVDKRKLLILDEILQSHNDNDPRLDSEFRDMTPELKRGMREYYRSIAAEKRNDLGTIVFLTARSMNSPEDVVFMKSVLMEKPCRSFSDCSKDAPAPTGEEVHLAGVSETTANYPQLTAIRQSLDAYRKALGANPPNHALADQIVSMFHEAQNSPNSRVADEARMVLKYIGK
ncbi:MAG: hypothetical protein JST80_04705 [Bdellovibrionales bacterium]|nr:hypothetical protein [Bdellovibrionales bacterium]